MSQVQILPGPPICDIMKLIFFDSDGVLTEDGSKKPVQLYIKKLIDEGLLKKDTIEELPALFERFNQQDESSIKDIFKALMLSFKGLPFEKVRHIEEEFLRSLKIRKEARHVFDELRKKGYKIIIVTSTPQTVAEGMLKLAKADEAYHHQAEILDGKLTGKWTRFVGPAEKASIVKEAAKKYGVTVKDCAAVGDSWIDDKMLNTVGKGFVINYKDKERIKRNGWTELHNLKELLDYL